MYPSSHNCSLQYSEGKDHLIIELKKKTQHLQPSSNEELANHLNGETRAVKKITRACHRKP